MIELRISAACAALSLCLTSGIAQTAVDYHRVARYVVGGEGGWDYLAVGPNGRLFISRGNHTMVVSTTTGKVVGDIPDTAGVHGIAFSPKLGRGYTSNGRDNTVTVFSLASLKVIKKIPITGQNPDCIIYEPITARVFTFNGRTGDVSAIDTLKDKEIGKVQVGGKLEFAVSDPQGHVFLNNESTSEVVEFDAASLKILKKWSIAPGEGPSGLAIDTKHHHLFSVTDGKMIVSDTKAGKEIASVPIGEGPDAAAFDPGLGLAFSSNGETATLSVVRAGASSFKVIGTVATEAGARTMALDPKTHRVYLVTAGRSGTSSGGGRPQMVQNSFVILVYAP